MRVGGSVREVVAGAGWVYPSFSFEWDFGYMIPDVFFFFKKNYGY